MHRKNLQAHVDGSEIYLRRTNDVQEKRNARSKINVFRKSDGFGGKFLKNWRKTDVVC